MLPAVRGELNEGWSLEGAVQAFFDKGFKDGEVVSREWLLWALDIPAARSVAQVTEIQWMLMERIEQLKSVLLHEHQILLANVRGKGYLVVPPQDQAKYAVSVSLKEVRKALSKGRDMLENTRVSELSNHERQRHADAHVKLSAIGEMFGRQKRDIFKLFKPQPEQTA